mgnify:FL=1
MKVAKNHRGDILIVAAAGELDHHTAAVLKSSIQEELDKGRVRHIILDLSALSFMDSSGLGVLLGRYKELAKWQGNMLAFGLHPLVEKLFLMTGLNKLIPVYANLDECLRAMGV